MAAQTNNGFYLSNALGRTESTNHRLATAEFARISHDVYGLDIPGLVSQRPPGISGRADTTAQTDIDARRTTAIAPVEAIINGGLPGLDNSGALSQYLDLNSPAQRSADPQPEAFRIEPYRQFFERRSDQLLRQTEASDENQPPRRTDTYGLHNHETNLDNLMNEINTATSGLSNNKAETFLQSLPLVVIVDLPDNNRDCPICMEQYLISEHYEPPVRLPCDHVIGKNCLRSWLQSSVLNRNNNTCPMCRTVLYNRDILANQLGDLGGPIDQLPEGTTLRDHFERARFRREASNRLRSAREQRGEWGPPRRLQNMTTRAFEQLREFDRSNSALREDPARLQEVNRARVEELNAMIPPSGSAARPQVAMRPEREQVHRIQDVAMEAMDRQSRRMRARADRDSDVEIAVRRDYLRPLRERRGAM